MTPELGGGWCASARAACTGLRRKDLEWTFELGRVTPQMEIASLCPQLPHFELSLTDSMFAFDLLGRTTNKRWVTVSENRERGLDCRPMLTG